MVQTKQFGPVVEHLVIEINGKCLPFNEAMGSDPFYKLVFANKQGKETVVYSSECVKKCFEPRWLAFDLLDNELDFEQELKIVCYDNCNFYVPKYIAETTTPFKASHLRGQFVKRKLQLHDVTGEKRGDMGYVTIRRLVCKDHSSKNSNNPTVEDLSDIFHYRKHPERLSAFWTRTNARREREEEEFLKNLRIQFDHFDIDGNGTIDTEEFMIILPEVWGGRTVSEEEVLEIITEVDINFDGVVDFEEFRVCVKVLDRRYEAIIREEKRLDRKKRLEEREKCEWDRKNEERMKETIEAQKAFVEKQEAIRASRGSMCEGDPAKAERLRQRMERLSKGEDVSDMEEEEEVSEGCGEGDEYEEVMYEANEDTMEECSGEMVEAQ